MFEKMWHMTLVLASTFPYPTVESGAVALGARMMRSGSRIVTWDWRRRCRTIDSKAAPNNYRIDRVSGDPSVIARSPCDEAIQGPQHAGRQQSRRSYCGPWIAHMGILASRVDFSFSCCGLFDVAGAGFRRAESAVELMEAGFSGGSGLSRGATRRRRRAWRALDGPEPPEVLRT